MPGPGPGGLHFASRLNEWSARCSHAPMISMPAGIEASVAPDE